MNEEKLQAIAQEIADAEQIIQTTDDKHEQQKAQKKIIDLSGQVSIFDLFVLDDMVQEIIEKKVEP